MKLDNKGFTLVELLAVVVVLIAISSIAIPTISSSLERSREKRYKAKVKLVESAAKLYASDHKEVFDNEWDFCNILVSTLVSNDYIDSDDDISSDSCVWYTMDNNTFEYKEDGQCNEEMQCGVGPKVMLE